MPHSELGILQRLRTLWGSPEGERYLASLIIDERGGRAGFSREVFKDLLKRLLSQIPEKRLGYENDAASIKQH